MQLAELENILNNSGLLDSIRAVCDGKTECYLVGGAIRDFLSGRPSNDFDFCFPADANVYAEQLAKMVGATWFVLDKERGHSRMVLKGQEQKLTCDFAPFRAPSLESDLRKRDFTINAMAIACHRGDFVLVDPLHGRNDLKAKRLRMCSEYSFQEDPLRCLKGIRHAATLGLEIEPVTMQRLTDSAAQIDQVASERIRSELSRAIDCEQSGQTFELLGLTGLHRELFGPAGPEAYAAALTMVTEINSIIKAMESGNCGQVVEKYLDGFCEEDVSLRVALKLAAFFYGYRPVAPKSVLNALRFSNRVISLMDQLLSMDGDVTASLSEIADKPRSRARWLADTGREPLASAIFLPLVASGARQDNLLAAELLIDSFVSCSVNNQLQELAAGDWLKEQLGIAEGPEIGRVQELVHQAELSGKVSTSAEAQRWLLETQK